jgi:hypothetical protein
MNDNLLIDNFKIIKYNYLDLNKIIYMDNFILYENNTLYIQTPLFNNYKILNNFNKKYIQIILDQNNNKHVKFYNLIETIEKQINTEHHIKSQIIKESNVISLKIKLNNDFKLYDKNKNEIMKNNLDIVKHKIILLLNFDIYTNYYSIICTQILEL